MNTPKNDRESSLPFCVIYDRNSGEKRNTKSISPRLIQKVVNPKKKM